MVAGGQVEQQLVERLRSAITAAHLSVENESHRHSVPPGSESHFKVTLVSDDFRDMALVKRHQAVYRAAGDLLKGPIHALALHLYDPEEWQSTDHVPASPDCRGGSRVDDGVRDE